MRLGDDGRWRLGRTYEKGCDGCTGADSENGSHFLCLCSDVLPRYKSKIFALDGERAVEPELQSLPVRIHVVLSQVELTLADLENLTEGSVIELESRTGESAQLVMNGHVLGKGDLVDVDGRLGIQITHWKES